MTEETTVNRPENITDEMLQYLDDLRKTGVTNMLGAEAYIGFVFGLPKSESRKILSYWMKTFRKDDR
jgi:hypothetical protein